MRQLRLWAVAVSSLLLAAACGSSGDRVVVAAGTTLVDSGFIDQLAEAYEADRRGIEISVVGSSTKEVLELGERGAADLLITHAPLQEAAFLASHPEATAVSLFESRFLLVGPPSRSVMLDGLDVETAFIRIAAFGWSFVTRADGSGTYDVEMEVWQGAGVDPAGGVWYSETGQGMGLSLQVADQKEAFILVEEGSFLSVRGVLRLRPVVLAAAPANPYTAIVLEPSSPAADFTAWLTSQQGVAAIAATNLELFGAPVYSARP